MCENKKYGFYDGLLYKENITDKAKLTDKT